jgi:sugar phosphate permease
MTILTPTLPAEAGAEDDIKRIAYSKVFWRIVPFLMLCFVVAYLDRVNVGFAKLQMSTDLAFSETVYGLGAGIFFIGYFLFEVPSNVILHKVGARVWIARIMITWGLISAGFMFTASALMFYLLRFLLGVAEAATPASSSSSPTGIPRIGAPRSSRYSCPRSPSRGLSVIRFLAGSWIRSMAATALLAGSGCS